MDILKRGKLQEMLNCIYDYCDQQPKVIVDLCKKLSISREFKPVLDLMIETFFSFISFKLLITEGLVSNASAILRILIEEVSILTVVCEDKNAMTEFLKFQQKKNEYYGTTGKEHKEVAEKLFLEAGCDNKKEAALKTYLDYGWIEAVTKNSKERGLNAVIRAAHLQETIFDKEEYLNAFSHGQQSIFRFSKNKNLEDKYLSRIIMISGKLFQFACYSKSKFFSEFNSLPDILYDKILGANIIYFDLNSRATKENIVLLVSESNNLDRDIILSIDTFNKMDHILKHSASTPKYYNFLARAYVIACINLLYMISYKLFEDVREDFSNTTTALYKLIAKMGNETIKTYYNKNDHLIEFEQLIKMADKIDDKWRPMDQRGNIIELDKIFIDELTSFVYSLFDAAFSELEKNELTKKYIPQNG